MLNTVVRLSEEADVDLAIGVAQSAAVEIGLPEVLSSHLACAVSEVSTNAVRHGADGEMLVHATPNGLGLEIEIRDEGPGIADVERAFVDGYTTSCESLGIGLGAAKRAVEYLQVETAPGAGTRVVLRCYPPLPESKHDLGFVSLPDANYAENGDHLFVHEVEGERLLAGVIDGLGQGRTAQQAALTASRAIATDYSLPLEDLVAKAHDSIRAEVKDSGVAIGIVSLGKTAVEYLGIGDTSLRVFAPEGNEPHRFFGKAGLVGSNLGVRGRLERCDLEPEEQVTVVLHTDGVSEHFSGRDLPLDEPAQDIADFLMANHRRPYGDSTVLVIKK